MTAEPTRRLAPAARWAWTLEQAFLWTVAFIGGLIAVGELDLPGALRLVPVAGFVIGVTVVPTLRWRRWRWDVSPTAIEIRHGTFTVRHTVVPMLRVQHVDTTSDLVEQLLSLWSVEVHTAARSHKIPLLTAHDAEEMRRRIAELARTDEP